MRWACITQMISKDGLSKSSLKVEEETSNWKVRFNNNSHNKTEEKQEEVAELSSQWMEFN